MVTQTLFIDFETFVDSESGYSLSELSIPEYIRNEKFRIYGFGYRWEHEDKTHWVEEPHTMAAWIKAQDWTNTVVVSHNVKFDGSILAWKFGVQPLRWVDTLGMAKAVIGSQTPRFSLDALAKYYGIPGKVEIDLDGVTVPTPEMADYCRQDVDICRELYLRLRPAFPASQWWHLDWTARCFIEPKFVLDQTVLEEGVEHEKERRERAIAASGIPKEILSSNKQFAEHLRAIGIQVPVKTNKSGKSIPALSKSDTELAELLPSHIYEGRLAAKSVLGETRGETLLRISRSGPLPCDVVFSGAVQTHRYSGGGQAGGNFQNFTRGSYLREAVTAPKEHSLIVSDFSAIELRVLAWLAQEAKLTIPLTNGTDIYCEFASLRYKRRITKADKAERQFGKTCILGLGYSMGYKKFAAQVKAVLGEDLNENEARAVVALYRSTYQRVPFLWKMAESVIPYIAEGRISCLPFAPFVKVKKGCLVLPSGLEVRYPSLKRNGEEWEYTYYDKRAEPFQRKLYGGKVVENVCQALAGEICKTAIERIERKGIIVSGAVHDEVIAIVPTARQDEFTNDVQELMEQSPIWWKEIKLKAEAHYGKSWLEAK